MKGKLIAIVFLALLLIGIAYVRALFSNQERAISQLSSVSGTVPEDILVEYLNKDEAAHRVDSVFRLFSDSLAKLNEYWTSMIDSMPLEESDSLENTIADLKEELKDTEERLTQARQERSNQFEKMVKAFYSGEISRLPSDLSNYEREVSIKEIKGKARDYFEISSKRLNEIISERN